MAFTLPELPFGYEDLAPVMDKRTLEIHHGKHHQAYVNNSNAAVEGIAAFEGMSAIDVLRNLDKAPADKVMAVRNNVGGHVNHSLFWKGLKKGTTLQGDSKAAIERDFGSVDAFRAQFAQAAATRFGSGWAWLILKDGKLSIASTPNQDTPVMGKEISGVDGYPVLVIDVWEHAYYLCYQNRRPDFIEDFWEIINWDEAAARFAQQYD